MNVRLNLRSVVSIKWILIASFYWHFIDTEPDVDVGLLLSSIFVFYCVPMLDKKLYFIVHLLSTVYFFSLARSFRGMKFM